jgi:hypothetical protein
MTGNFKASHYETPEERLKRMILERLDDAALADSQFKKKEFCVFIKHFLLLLKSDIPKNIQETIENRHTELDKKIKELEGGDKSPESREKDIVNAMYPVYSQDLVDGIDSMRNSKIMQRQMAGIILSGKSMAELNNIGKRVRESDAVETVVEEQEGMEDGGAVE